MPNARPPGLSTCSVPTSQSCRKGGVFPPQNQHNIRGSTLRWGAPAGDGGFQGPKAALPCLRRHSNCLEKPVVSVCSSCPSKMPQTRQLKQREIVSQSPGAGSPRAGLIPRETSLPGLSMAIFISWPHVALPCVCLPGLTSSPWCWGLGLQPRHFEGGCTVQFMTPLSL